MSDTALFRREHRVERSHHIVAKACDRVAFDQRDMFVRRGMEQRLGPVAPQYPADRRPVGDVAKLGDNHGGKVHAPRELDQLAIDLVKRELGLLHQDQPAGPASNDLAAKLAPDRSAGAGHQHDLAGDIPAHQQLVRRNGIAAEQFLDLHVAKIANRDAALDDMPDAGQGSYRDILRRQEFDDLASPRAGRAGNGEQDFLNSEIVDDIFVLARRKDRNAVEQLLVETRVVVDESHHLQLRFMA